jgi:Na+/proline symporter/signal transduction histidine kinase
LSPVILFTALISYMALLFWIARIADRQRFNLSSWSHHPLVYTLALGVYCTSWTFYGLVGTAASKGWYYLPILLGPILLFTLGFPLLQRIAKVSKEHNIHSIADFITSRYGKRQSVAAIITLIMLATTVPYIALQLKAVSDTLLFSVQSNPFAGQNMTLIVSGVMILFTLIFGANRLDVASYHSGIMAAIAFESLIKLIALVTIAIFALNLSGSIDPTQLNSSANDVFHNPTITPSFLILTFVSAATIFCLPRMFQITFVECLSERHLLYARRGFSLYLLIIIIAVFCIAWVGNQVLTGTGVTSDTYVLALPLGTGNKLLTLLAFIGGFSAATAMIIVATLTLSQMLSNDVILPLLIKKQKTGNTIPDYSRALFRTRRLTVIAIILMSWIYQHYLAENVALTEIGLIAFALAVQLAPAIILGLYWQRGNALGMFAGLACGTLIWFMSLMTPLLCHAGFIDPDILSHGIFGFHLLRPDQLFGLSFSDSYTRGVVLSLAANILAFYYVSTLNRTRLSDRLQAFAFVNRERTKPHHDAQHLQINKADLSIMLTQFLGESATMRLFESEQRPEMVRVSPKMLEHAELALAGVVGVASSRAILSSLSSGENLGVEDVVNIFEETTRSLQFNQEMLFASFESISSAISVVNADLKIVAWNKRYEHLFQYPTGILHVGQSVAELVRYNAERGMLGKGDVEQQIQKRLKHLIAGKPYRVVRNHNQSVIEIKGRALPTGGYVTTYDDITEFINAQNILEQRVKKRTEQIEKINQSLRVEVSKHSETEKALIKAKSTAETSNASKTQFLATASHDILQPLNAASLYASALMEKTDEDPENIENLQHLHNAIDSAELIISNLLEISRLDTGSFTPKPVAFALSDILEPLANEFRVQTYSGVSFKWQHTSLWSKSDPQYLRRILQNFLSNAVKYTTTGKVLLGCRRRQKDIEICIYDSGPGISEAHQERIFDDFYRVANNVGGAGLGLGIALRFADLLNHRIRVQSFGEHGCLFSLHVPMHAKVTSAPVADAGSRAVSGLENLKLYYVDDDEDNIHALSTLTDNWGCTLSSSTTVAAAIDFAKNNAAPDVILMDYQLDPTTSGIELADALLYQWGHIPVCVISAASDADLPARVTEHGFDFLRKPVKPGKLRALLDRYLQRKNDKSISKTKIN